MIVAIVLAYLVTTATAVPVTPGTALPQVKSRDLPVQKSLHVEASSMKPGPQVVVQIQPSVQQPQSVVPQNQGTQGGGPFLMPFQPHPWGPQLLMPFQPNTQGAAQPAIQPALQPGPQPQHPQMFPNYGYFHMFPTPQGNQLFSPYGMPMFFPQAAVPQFPAPTGPVEPAVTPSRPEPPAPAPVPEEPQQQLQYPQVVWFQQPMNPAGLSSEELEMAGRTGHVGLYLPNVGGANLPRAPVKPVSPASLPTGAVNLNPALPAFRLASPALIPSMGVLLGGLPTGEVTQPWVTTMDASPLGPQPGLMDVPVGLEAATVPAEPVATLPPLFEEDFLPETTPTAGIAMETYP